MFCSPLKIHTICCLYDFAIKIDLRTLSDDMLQKSKNYMTFEYITDTIKSNGKIGNSGIVQLLGIKSLEEAKIVLDYVGNIINSSVKIDPNGIRIMMINGSFQLFQDSNLTTRLNKDLDLFRWHETIDKKYCIKGKFHNMGNDDNSNYSLILNIYWCNEHKLSIGRCKCQKPKKKSTVFIYKTGTITVANPHSFHEIEEIYQFLFKVIKVLV